jgi:protein TonB
MKILLLTPLLAIALSACASDAVSTASASATPEANVSAAGLRKQEPAAVAAPVTGQVAPAPAPAPQRITNAGSSLGLNCRVPVPAYPADAREAHQEGTVWVRLRMSADGTPTSVTVARSSGYAALDNAAVGAISHMQCRPLGHAVTLTQPIAFRLDRPTGTKAIPGPGPGPVPGPAPTPPVPAAPPA